MGFFDWMQRSKLPALAPRPAPRCVVSAQQFESVLTRLSAAAPGTRVLELGCGAGVLSLSMAQSAPQCRIHGVDPDSDAVRHAAATAKSAGLSEQVRFSPSDLRVIAVADASCELVVGAGALMQCSAPAGTLREIRRVLVPGGIAILFEPLVPEEPELAPGRRAPTERGQPFSAAALRQLLLESPFVQAARLTVPPARGIGSCAELLLLRTQ